MARGIYFSGDLAAMNEAMASEERNLIAGRTANQGFLSNLASQATARRGQDVTERVSNRQMDTDKSIASERTGVMSKQVDNDFQAALAANAVKRQAIQVETDKINALEREGIRVDTREKERVKQAAIDADKQRNALIGISIIQSNAAQGKLDPRLAQDVFAANLEVDAYNQSATAAAESANRKARDNARSWYMPESKEYISPSDARAALSALQEGQQGLVQIGPGGTNFVPRLRQRVNLTAQGQQDNSLLSLLPQLFGLTNAAPSVATPGINPTVPNPPGSKGPGDAMTPRLITPAESTNAPVSLDLNRPGATNTVQIEDILRGRQDLGSPVARTNAVETPADRAMVPSFEPGTAPLQEPGAGMESLQSLLLALRQGDDNRILANEFQGPPVRMSNPRLRPPIGSTSDPAFNPGYGTYMQPDGSAMNVPMFRAPQAPAQTNLTQMVQELLQSPALPSSVDSRTAAPALQALLLALRQADDQRILESEVQGPPVRLRNPRLRPPIGSRSDPYFNPDYGTYAQPGGQVFQVPMFQR